MISLDDVRAVRREMFDRSMGLVEKKGHDYNRAQQHTGDTLFNLRVASPARRGGPARARGHGAALRTS